MVPIVEEHPFPDEKLTPISQTTGKVIWGTLAAIAKEKNSSPNQYLQAVLETARTIQGVAILRQCHDDFVQWHTGQSIPPLTRPQLKAFIGALQIMQDVYGNATDLQVQLRCQAIFNRLSDPEIIQEVYAESQKAAVPVEHMPVSSMDDSMLGGIRAALEEAVKEKKLRGEPLNDLKAEQICGYIIREGIAEQCNLPKDDMESKISLVLRAAEVQRKNDSDAAKALREAEGKRGWSNRSPKEKRSIEDVQAEALLHYIESEAAREKYAIANRIATPELMEERRRAFEYGFHL